MLFLDKIIFHLIISLLIISPKDNIPAFPAKAGENPMVFKLFQPISEKGSFSSFSSRSGHPGKMPRWLKYKRERWLKEGHQPMKEICQRYLYTLPSEWIPESCCLIATCSKNTIPLGVENCLKTKQTTPKQSKNETTTNA